MIACHSDPRLALCREATDKPVFGIQESGLFSALLHGARVGVVALGPKSIVPRKVPPAIQIFRFELIVSTAMGGSCLSRMG